MLPRPEVPPDPRRQLGADRVFPSRAILNVVKARPGIFLTDLSRVCEIPVEQLRAKLEERQQRGHAEVIKQGQHSRCFPTNDARELKHWRLLLGCTDVNAATAHLWARTYGMAPHRRLIAEMEAQHGWKPDQTRKILAGLVEQGLIRRRRNGGELLLAAMQLPINQAQPDVLQALKKLESRGRRDSRPARGRVVPKKQIQRHR